MLGLFSRAVDFIRLIQEQRPPQKVIRQLQKLRAHLLQNLKLPLRLKQRVKLHQKVVSSSYQ